MQSVKRLRTNWLHKVNRATALLLACACLWVSGGATLSHTEDVASFLTFHSGRALLSHAAGLNAADDGCRACQWENAAFDLHLPSIPLLIPVFVRVALPPVLPEAHSQRPFDHTSPRAPPAPLS